MKVNQLITIGIISSISLILGGKAMAMGNTAKAANEETAITTPTKYVSVGGTKFAYRRLGKKAGIPIVLFQHFTGTLDNWDPLVIDGLAKEREVIMFDNRGVAGSEGVVQPTYNAMALDGIAFIEALGLKKVDILGFSMGGGMVQMVAIDRPDLVRKVIIVGLAPRNGDGMQSLSLRAQAAFSKKVSRPDEIWLDVMFTQTPSSQAAGHRYLDRIRARKTGRDVEVSLNSKAAAGQMVAIEDWGKPEMEGETRFAYLKKIKQPTLIVNGDDDIVAPTINSFYLQQNIPNAKLLIFPDANHGSLEQYPLEFVKYVNSFLDTDFPTVN